MQKRIVGPGRVDLFLPDYRGICNEVIRRFMPIAGARITTAAKNRLGLYQLPGFRRWKRLAPATIRRKQKLLSRRGLSGEYPLIETKLMYESVRHAERGPRETVIMAGFPAHVHEQDPLVAPFTLPPNNLPRREFLWPALTNMKETLTRELEERVARAL
jgi:hypothetical protein